MYGVLFLCASMLERKELVDQYKHYWSFIVTKILFQPRLSSIVLFLYSCSFLSLTLDIKRHFNEHFGSMFRTHNKATLFAYNVQRYGKIIDEVYELTFCVSVQRIISNKEKEVVWEKERENMAWWLHVFHVCFILMPWSISLCFSTLSYSWIADVYTSRVQNFLRYSLSSHFFPGMFSFVMSCPLIVIFVIPRRNFSSFRSFF